MEFPGLLGVGLFRLGEWLRAAPMAALGPLFGFASADVSADIVSGRLGNVAVEVVITLVFAVVVLRVVGHPGRGLSGQLLLALGVISAIGGSALLSLGLTNGVAPVTIIGLRHLAFAAYAWAAIAAEPPRRRPRFRMVRA